MANSFVQQRNSNGTGNSISLAFSSNNAAGNLLVAQVASAGTSLAGASVSDTNNGSYTQDDSDAISGAPVATYHFGNCAAGANTVTFSVTASGGFIEIVILEFSGGGNTTWAKRTSAHNNGSGTSASPGAMTVVSGDVCVSYAQFLTAPPTGGASGWTYTETAAANGTEYLIASGTSVTGSFACNSTAWVAGSVAFDSSSSGTVNLGSVTMQGALGIRNAPVIVGKMPSVTMQGLLGIRNSPVVVGKMPSVTMQAALGINPATVVGKMPSTAMQAKLGITSATIGKLLISAGQMTGLLGIKPGPALSAGQQPTVTEFFTDGTGVHRISQINPQTGD